MRIMWFGKGWVGWYPGEFEAGGVNRDWVGKGIEMAREGLGGSSERGFELGLVASVNGGFWGWGVTWTYRDLSALFLYGNILPVIHFCPTFCEAAHCSKRLTSHDVNASRSTG